MSILNLIIYRKKAKLSNNTHSYLRGEQAGQNTKDIALLITVFKNKHLNQYPMDPDDQLQHSPDRRG